MNSMGTPPIVQKNRSTPGIPVSNTVTSSANVVAFSRTPPKSSVRNDSAARPSGAMSRRCSRNVEHFDQARVAGAEHGDVGSVGRRPAQRLLQDLPRHAHLELNLHPDDIGQERDERLRRMAAHDHVMQMSRHGGPSLCAQHDEAAVDGHELSSHEM